MLSKAKHPRKDQIFRAASRLFNGNVLLNRIDDRTSWLVEKLEAARKRLAVLGPFAAAQGDPSFGWPSIAFRMLP